MTDAAETQSLRPLIETLFAAWSRGATAEVADLFAAEARVELCCLGAVFEGRAAISRGWVGESLALYPVNRRHIVALHEVRDTAIVEYVFQGSSPEHDEPLEANGCALYQVRAGRIVAARIYGSS